MLNVSSSPFDPGRVKTRVLALNTPILEKCILQLDAVSASSVAVSNSLRKHFRFGCSAHEFSHGLGKVEMWRGGCRPNISVVRLFRLAVP